MRFAEVEEWVRAELPPSPARVLEVGAGDGALARALAAAGYDVDAIDPKSESPDVRPVALADLPEPPRPFDAAVAVVSLHHVEPLEQSVERLAAVLAPGAPLLVDEFDVDTLDERAAAWWLGRRRALAEHGHEDESPAELIETMRDHVHSLARLIAALEPWFDVGAPLRGTYLYRWKLGEALRPLEEELVAAGVLPPTGARVIARRRAQPPRDGPPRRGRRSRVPSRS